MPTANPATIESKTSRRRTRTPGWRTTAAHRAAWKTRFRTFASHREGEVAEAGLGERGAHAPQVDLRRRERRERRDHREPGEPQDAPAARPLLGRHGERAEPIPEAGHGAAQDTRGAGGREGATWPTVATVAVDVVRRRATLD